MMPLKPIEVFTPGIFPTHTYVKRDESRHEESLKTALEVPGFIVSVTGPSKSGKTVLVEQVVGQERLLTVAGGTFSSVDELWSTVLSHLELPIAVAKSHSSTIQGGASVEGKAKIAMPLVSAASLKGQGQFGGSRSRTTQHTLPVSRLDSVVAGLKSQDRVLLIDDFHYVTKPVQRSLGKQLKEAVRQGAHVCLASVPHRSDDAVRALPDLRGRVRDVPLDYWALEDLMQIGHKGFKALKLPIERSQVKRLAVEAAGSPQLMQLACLELSLLALKANEIDDADMHEVLEKAAQTVDYKSLTRALAAGPKTRGTPRVTYVLRDKTSADVYRCVLEAIAADPPQLSFSYSQLVDRVRLICRSTPPSGSSISTSCKQMKKIVDDRNESPIAIDWSDESEQFDITDPYLLFYLRWSQWRQKK